MELFQAIELIRFKPSSNKPQTWADLGCGKGLFTRALASLLPKGSYIHAIDRDVKSMKQIPAGFNDVIIKKTVNDFTTNLLPSQMDGILMANALHYVADKINFLKTHFHSLRDGGYLLIVDYDVQSANQWVPFPITIKEARDLFAKIGFSSFQVLNQRPSMFGNHNMYAAISGK